VSDPLTDAELAAMRLRLEKASGAPWRRGIGNEARIVFCEAGRVVAECVAKNTGYDDGTFIADARQDVPRLLVDLDRLRAENAALRRQAAGPAGRIAATETTQ
jgi:hypothetical protein